MSVSGRELLRIAVPMTGIILAGWLLSWFFNQWGAFPPAHVVGYPLADLSRTVALAVAIVYGVRTEP